LFARRDRDAVADIAAGVLMFLLAGCGGQSTPWRPPSGNTLSPDVYRPQIVAIDRIVFQNGPIDANGQDDLVASINELADRIDSAHPSALVTTLNRNLRQLGQVSPRNMPVLQREWIRIRDGLFNDASWYRRSSSDPVASVHTAEGAAGTKQLKRAMLDLMAMLISARSSPRDTTDALRWNEKLDAIVNEMPDEPADPNYAKAYRRANDAILLARQKRLDESYANVDTAFRFFMRGS
jgi:hypothetical protein